MRMAIAGNSTWAEGDWNCDGDFNSGDFVAAFQAGGYVAAARPAALSALTAGWSYEDPTMPRAASTACDDRGSATDHATTTNSPGVASRGFGFRNA